MVNSGIIFQMKAKLNIQWNQKQALGTTLIFSKIPQKLRKGMCSRYGWIMVIILIMRHIVTL